MRQNSRVQGCYNLIKKHIELISKKGDISLDDLEISDNFCPTIGFFNCDFEKDTCGFSFETTGYYNWTRRAGKATTALTGPSVDHTVKITTKNYSKKVKNTKTIY